MADDLDKENQESNFSFDDDSGGGASGMGDEFNDFNNQQSLGSAIQNNVALKIGVIAAAVVFIIGGFVLFGGSSSDKDKNNSSLGTSGNKINEAPTANEVSPEMKEAITDFNETGLEEASKTDESFIPVPTGPAVNTGIVVPQDEEIQEDPLERWRLLQEERAQQQREQLALSQDQQRKPGELSPEEQKRQQAVESLAQSMVAAMQTLSQEQAFKNMQVKEVLDDKEYYEKLQDEDHDKAIKKLEKRKELIEKQAELAEIDPSMQAAAAEGRLLISEGTIEYAQMLIQANSDIPGPVLAQLVTGPLKGSRLIGSFTKEKKHLVIKFDTVVVNGISINISAVAVDPNNNLTGVATEVDNRYFKRLVLPVAAEFISGFAEAVAQTQQDTFVTGDVVITSSNDLDTDEAVAQAIEDAGDVLSDFVQEEGDKTEILVKVAAGTPIGVLFTDPVIEAIEATPTTVTSSK